MLVIRGLGGMIIPICTKEQKKISFEKRCKYTTLLAYKYLLDQRHYWAVFVIMFITSTKGITHKICFLSYNNIFHILDHAYHSIPATAAFEVVMHSQATDLGGWILGMS